MKMALYQSVISPKHTHESYSTFLKKTTYFSYFFFSLILSFFIQQKIYNIKKCKRLTKQIAVLLARAFWNLYIYLTRARRRRVIVVSLSVCLCVCVLQANLCEYSILMFLGHCFQNTNF